LANVPAYFASMTFFSIYMDILLLGLKKKEKNTRTSSKDRQD
jgi:hypothetical protein